MRRWSIVRGSRGPVSGGAAYGKTLAELRKLVPRDMVCIQRMPDDDPCIVEVWTHELNPRKSPSALCLVSRCPR